MPPADHGARPAGAAAQDQGDVAVEVLVDEIGWDHVGTLGYYAELLKRVTDRAFKEGEHAE